MKNKYSQEQLANAINISRTAISSYELGRNEPPYDILIKIATLLDCDINYLLGVTDRLMPFYPDDTPTLNNATDYEITNAYLTRIGIIKEGERIVQRQATLLNEIITANKKFIFNNKYEIEYKKR